MITRKFFPICAAFVLSLLLCAPPALRAQEENSSSATTSDASGAEATTASSKDVMSDSGKEVVNDSGKEVASHLGTGNFAKSPFHVSVAVREGYDDNVYTTKLNTVGSFFTNGSVVLDYKFGSPRTQFDLQAVAGATYYYYRPFGQEYDVNTSLTLGLEHHATPRLTFTISAYATYQSEPDFISNFGGLDRRGGNFFYTADKFAVGYQWAPRFSTVTSYTLGVIQYESSEIGAFEDRFEHTFGNEFRFLVLPTTTLVGEYRYQLVDFDDANRDSETHFLLAGIDHTFNPRFNISVRAGVEFREFDNFGERTSPYAEATLRYAIANRTSISWVNRYGLEEPDVPGTPSRETFRTGLVFSHGFTPRITATGSIFYQHDDNEGFETTTFFEPQFDEETLDIGLGLRYEINRVFAVLAGYSHTEVFSDIFLREYSRNRYYLGVSATF